MPASFRLAVASAAVLLAGCAVVADPSPPADPVPVVRDGEFQLEVAAPKATWVAGEPIDVTARLSYLGPGDGAHIGGSGGGPIAFSLTELGGTRKLDGILTADCAPHAVSADAPIISPYEKSGGVNPGEPNEAFFRSFLSDPEFRLPSGRWLVTAWASFNSEEGCTGRQVDLRASLILTIE